MNKAKKNNITIRIVSILIAVIMWSYVMNEVNPQTTKLFPGIKVDYINQDYLSEAGLAIMEPKEAKITVELAGRRSDINNINPNDIIVQADLLGYVEGVNRMIIDVKAPENVTVKSVSPQYIQLKLDSIITKEFNVSLETSGNTEDGHTPGEGEIKPSTVLIKGPRTWVNSVYKVVTTVQLSNINTDIKTSLPVRALDDKKEEVRGIEKEPNTVEVIMPILGTKNIPIRPRLKGSPLNGYIITDIQMNPVSIKVKGKKEILKDIEFLETEPIDIDLISISKDVPVNIVFPEGVELMDDKIKPLAKINVEKIIEKDIELDTSKLTFINLDTRYVVDKTSLPDKITITVRGAEGKIDALSENDITFYSDLSGLEKGTHSVNVKVILQEDIELIHTEPETIQLTIEEEF
ncbi:CdaR family protein [Proteiniborus sp. MB09-C3]|uniref:CdaR family protein n=1 Tax=Proteiniborus sp. MB09-C3 TaxID=3050072 RepID=UPI002552FBD4|nr:CdaR family protein [Proteiniborus sp. MB09-C3]WIV13312.1 CdaR family protein [Proteiniborus sp. MB09-C3]